MTSSLPRPEQAVTAAPASPRDHLRAFVKLWLHNAACGQALPPTIMARLDLLIDAVEDAACPCYPHPSDHEEDCSQRAARTATEESP
jgi:hypothetical protein